MYVEKTSAEGYKGFAVNILQPFCTYVPDSTALRTPTPTGYCLPLSAVMASAMRSNAASIALRCLNNAVHALTRLKSIVGRG